MSKQAKFYISKNNKTVQCVLCPHNCVIDNEKYGICRIRKNIDGVLYSETYNKLVSVCMDPIEKKPMYHYHPGKMILSIGSVGCNFKCLFCQNYTISQAGANNLELYEMSPEKLLELVKKEKSFGVAYTYNEPLINYEHLYECAKLMHEHKIKNVLVTNGYINLEPLKELLPYIDASNVDIKSFTEKFYHEVCFGSLEPVKKTIEEMYKNNVFIELTNLVIPELNDSLKEIEEMCKWIASIDKKIPLHFSRYYPCYKMNKPVTPIETLETSFKIAKKYLDYVYLGNVDDKQNTVCPKCKTIIIKRTGYDIDTTNLKGDACKNCGYKINIVN
jgi:pyruvate formate lyase activating enzyme